MISLDTLLTAAQMARHATEIDESRDVEIVLTEEGFVVRGRTGSARAAVDILYAEVTDANFPILCEAVRIVTARLPVEQVASAHERQGREAAPSGQGVSGEVREAGWTYEYDSGAGWETHTVLNTPPNLPTKRAPTKHYGSTDIRNVRPFYYAPAPSCAPGEVERLREALKPFAFEGVTIPRGLDRDALWFTDAVTGKSFTVGAVLDARAALSPQGLDAKPAPDAPECAKSCADPRWCTDTGACWRTNEWRNGAARPRVVATPSQRLDAATVERCAQIAETTVPLTIGAAVIKGVIAGKIRALATEPHQHGAGNGGAS